MLGENISQQLMAATSKPYSPTPCDASPDVTRCQLDLKATHRPTSMGGVKPSLVGCDRCTVVVLIIYQTKTHCEEGYKNANKPCTPTLAM